jgi:hypothetical protein
MIEISPLLCNAENDLSIFHGKNEESTGLARLVRRLHKYQ